MSVAPPVRRKSLPLNYKFNTGFLSVSSIQTQLSSSKENDKDLDILKFKDSKTHDKLLSKLEKSRKQILKDNDIYVSKEHKQLCYYNEKLIELKKKIKILNKHI